MCFSCFTWLQVRTLFYFFFFPSSFLLFLPVCLLLILSLWQRNRDMNICSEREVLSHSYFREFCCSLSPITSQINSFCLQWHLLVRAELINCGAGFIEAFKCSRCFFSLSPHLISKKVERVLENWYKPCSHR